MKKNLKSKKIEAKKTKKSWVRPKIAILSETEFTGPAMTKVHAQYTSGTTCSHFSADTWDVEQTMFTDCEGSPF